MIRRKIIFFAITILLLVVTAANGQNVRGFYLSNIGSWLGNTTQETQILEYAQGNGFNYIAFYDLGAVNWSSATDKNKLASFISRGRTQYGILQFGAVVEIFSFIQNNILPYNNSRANANEKFDILNMEFEFWVNSTISSSYCSKFLSPNGYSCDTAGAWAFAWKQFKLIDSASAANGLISEVYLGWPNRGQMQQLASRADRILLHAYRPTDGDIYAYSKNRLIDMASINTVKKVITLLSSEPAFMGSWLNSNPITKPYQTYSSNLAAETGSFKQYIDLQGYHWFTYEYMPHTMLAMATITASGPLSFCSGGSVSLTANSGAAYLWTPGGQTTRSITVTQPGSYTVQVTNSSGVNITSSPVVVSFATSGFTPTVSASGPVAFCPGESVTLTSSQSGSYQWSTGQTTQSITVSSSGNYSVTTSNGSCVGTSSAIQVNANAIPTPPTVTASGSTTICTGSTVTLTSSQANSYHWSNGATTPSITVNTSGNYTVTTGGTSCPATSSPVSVNVSSPAIPSVTASGPMTICPAGEVTLTSSSAGGYLWSTGETTQSIVVSGAGNYTVKAFSGPNCFSVSAVNTVNVFPAPAIPVVTPSGSTVLSQTNPSVTLSSSIAVSYLWSNSLNTQNIVVSSPGSYAVAITDGNGCVAVSNSVDVTSSSCIPPPMPTISLSGPSVLSSGQTVTLTSSTGGGYLWSTGETTQSIDVSAAGIYTVNVYNSGSCFSTSLPVEITNISATGINDPSLNGKEISFRLFPNPAREQFNIIFNLGSKRNLMLKLIDITGREIINQEIKGLYGENQVPVNVANVSHGVYFACLISDDQKKIIKVVIE